MFGKLTYKGRTWYSMVLKIATFNTSSSPFLKKIRKR